MPKQWYLAFDVKAMGTSEGWTNIIHVGTGGDMERYGDRSPSIWLAPGIFFNYFMIQKWVLQKMVQIEID